MELTTAIKESIDRSVLCWLATVSIDGMPNVSPKEIFNHYKEDKVIVANIASPQTVKNIKHSLLLPRNTCYIPKRPKNNRLKVQKKPTDFKPRKWK